jgi:ribosomal protein S18 acetylase RimI-like enzyme
MSISSSSVAGEIVLRHAAGNADMDEVRRLFRAYGDIAEFNVCFQGLEEEISSLPGDYSPPAGRLLLADRDGEVVGVVALRALPQAGAAEIKRLFVAADARGLGIGRRLTEAILAEASALGYRAIRLETLASMQAANAVYDDMGFVRIPTPSGAPSPDVICKELRF